MGPLYLWERSSLVRLALSLSSLGRGRVVRWSYRCSGMGRGCGASCGINGAWRRSRVVQCPDASTSNAESTADLAARADVVSSHTLMSSDSLGNQSGPESLSSGMMIGMDIKALQALEAMKSHHNFNSTISLESLGSIQKRFSISTKYVLHASGLGQQSYHPCPGGFGISIDPLEVGLRFPLHPVIGECLNWWRHDARQSLNWRGASQSYALGPGSSTIASASTAQRGSFSHIYPRHVDPSAGHGSVHSIVRGVHGWGSESYGAGARAQVLQMETELLDLARSKDALREDLPRRAEDYKKSPGFEMGLVRMGRVSLEYRFQLALAQLQARHPGVEIKLNPFVSLPEDDDILMTDEQPFDDSLPPPEE
ncbi:hypothetical protein B296_00027581 [Ensete ventricosum]|uniref:Uncharacterized protein n=1 Tax=Ensete ventricosum TaxID=4639 RepID=A0A426YZ99_ENSVE|nr:hypothetical protein B296_00027581 [Ensete ventricosum]